MMTDKDPWTTMLMGRKCRVIMGPCRQQELLSIVALVPDSERTWTLFRTSQLATILIPQASISLRLTVELMYEQASTSWTAPGSLEDLLHSFEDFPPWIKDTFK
jgi:salicylate hydroxylase